MDALEQILHEEWDAPVEAERATAGERFRIENEDQVDWALRKIAAVRAARQAVDAAAERHMRPIRDWQQAEHERLDRDEAYFAGLLADYHLRRLAEDPRAKTIRRPFGTLRSRVQEPEFERDDAALLAWLKERGKAEFVQITERPAWGELKKALDASDADALGQVRLVDPETGEVVPGVVGRLRPPKVTIETTAEEATNDGDR